MNCGGCKVCCTLFPISEIGKLMNTPCDYYDKGCTIHESKPKMCAEYECAYIQAKKVPKMLRPDKSGIVFTKKTKRIFIAALIPDIEITNTAKGQIKAFNEQGYSVILVSVKENKPLLMLNDSHNAEEIMKEYKEAISGNL